MTDSLEYLFGLDREADGYFGCAVENFKNMIAVQAAIFTCRRLSGIYFNPAIASTALRTGDIGFLHILENSITSSVALRGSKGPLKKN
jgi:hypothetical protein